MKPPSRWLIPCLPCALAMAAPGPALAQTQPTTPVAASPTPRQLLEHGVAAFEAQDYPTALTFFQQAYIAGRDPATLFNIATTMERLGRREDAITALQRYLANATDPENRRVAEARIRALRVSALAAEPPMPVPSTAPMPQASPSPAPPSSPLPRGEARSPSAPVWPWIPLVGGVVVVGVGVVLLATLSTPGPNETDYSTGLGGYAAQSGLGIAAIGVGSACVVLGVVGLIVTRGSHASEHAAAGWSLQPWMGERTGAALTLHF